MQRLVGARESGFRQPLGSLSSKWLPCLSHMNLQVSETVKL